MRAKEYLSQFGRYEDKIRCKLVEVYRNRVLAENVSVAFGVDRVQSSGSTDRVAQFVAAIVDGEQEVSALIHEYREYCAVALNRLEGMSLLGDAGMNQYRVLHSRFVERLSFEDIAESLHFSERQVYNLYRDGLNTFEELYFYE